MGGVSLNPKILDHHAGNLADISRRMEQQQQEMQQRGQQLLRRIAEAVEWRHRRAAELARQYDDCLRDRDADCSDLRRQLAIARQSLEEGLRTQRQATEAVQRYTAVSNPLRGRLEALTAAGRGTLDKLARNLEDYSAFSGLVSAALLASLAIPSAGTATALATTNQSYHSAKSAGRNLLIFDHPRRSARNAIFNQGSAVSDIQGTCGLCAAGSLLRKAGIEVTEGDMIAYAVEGDLCVVGPDPEQNGGTGPNQLMAVLSGLGGIPSSSHQGSTLSELATQIEVGHGVIIGVSARLLYPSQEDPFDPNDSDGHWIVLESVVRDADTGAILGFAMIDSNGTTSEQACQFVPLNRLQTAYLVDGADAITTDTVIW